MTTTQILDNILSFRENKNSEWSEYPFIQVVIKDNMNTLSKLDLLRICHGISSYTGLIWSVEDQAPCNTSYSNYCFEYGKQNRLHLHIVLQSTKKINSEYFTKWFKKAKFYSYQEVNCDKPILLAKPINTKSITISFNLIEDEEHHYRILYYMTKEQPKSISAFLD